MKLHHLEFFNLNSLHGTQEIDFDAKLSRAPLFLIVGPTGAGKTTILDAICVALFGTSPRVSDEKSQQSRTLAAERMMTKGTGICWVKLTFSLLDEQGRRTRYRARWRCDRAYKKAGKNVQPAERSLTKLHADGTDEVLVSTNKKKEYDDAFDELLNHMSLDTFLRSVMLAQGKFAAFLKSDDREKSEILERLTRTNIYTRIGARANTVRQAKQAQIAKLDTRLAELPEADEQTLADLHAQIDEVRSREARARRRIDQLRAQITWLQQSSTLRRHVDGAQERYAAAQQLHRDHRADFDRLAIAQRARPVSKHLDRFDQLIEQRSRTEAGIPDLTDALEAARAKLTRTMAALDDARQVLDAASAELERERPKIREAHELYARADEAEKQLRQAEAKQAQLIATLDIDGVDTLDIDELQHAAQHKLRAAQDRVDAAEQQHQRAKAALHALLHGAPDPGARRKALMRERDNLDQRERAVERAETLLAERIKHLDALAKTQGDARALDQKLAALSRESTLADEVVTAREKLQESARGELSRFEARRSLAARRAELEPGEPCQLCGSREHPYLDQTHEQPPDDQRAHLQNQLRVADAELAQARDRKGELRGALDAAKAEKSRLAALLTSHEAALKERTTQLRAALDALNLDVDSLDEVPSLLDTVSAQRREQRARLEEAFSTLDEADQAKTNARERLVEARAQLDQLRNQVDKLDDVYQAAALSREQFNAKNQAARAALDGRNPAQLEQALKNAHQTAKDAHDDAATSHARASEEAKVAENSLQHAQRNLTSLGEDIDAQRALLEEKLREQDFVDLPELRAARLEDHAFSALQQRTQRIAQQRDQADTALKLATKRLDEHLSNLPDALDPAEADLDALQAELAEQTKLDTDLTQALGGLEEKKNLQREHLERRLELEDRRRSLQADFKIWKRIHDLIGKNNGESFRKYAQRLNLRELLARTNKHLEQLEERYSLKLADDDSMNFEVADAHHAGGTRKLSTLSGGETFLISLALSLALADDRSQTLRMETLLLDEGFGTLDQESLSRALSALNNLHLSGDRQVGLISHVEGLKERIPHRIEVQKLGSGRSRLDVVVDGVKVGPSATG